MMLSLLSELKTEGYPLDFLLARLRARRERWPQAVRGGSPRPAEPWSTLQRELCWLYASMNRKSRQQFGFCFLLFELRRLLIALRGLAGLSRDGLERLAGQSLLNRDLLDRLRSAPTIADAARVLDTALATESGALPQLEQILVEQGYRQMEERLLDSFYRQAATRSTNPALVLFFSRLIDLRNLLTILKFRRWKLSEPGPLLAGGTCTPQQWQELLRPGREARLRKRVGRLSGSEGFDAESVEHALLGRIQRSLDRQARIEPDPHLVLYYLWAHYLHARNLGLQHWAGDQLAAWEKLG